eukprot:260053_1
MLQLIVVSMIAVFINLVIEKSYRRGSLVKRSATTNSLIIFVCINTFSLLVCIEISNIWILIFLDRSSFTKICDGLNLFLSKTLLTIELVNDNGNKSWKTVGCGQISLLRNKFNPSHILVKLERSKKIKIHIFQCRPKVKRY